MQRLTPRVCGVILALVFAPGCAGINQSLRTLIEKGKYAEAIEDGMEWLADHRAKEDERKLVAEVDQLVCEAHYRKAAAADTVDAYREFAVTFPQRWQFGEFLDLALAREAHAFYRDAVKPSADIGMYRRLRATYAGAPDLAEARAGEVKLAWAAASKTDTPATYETFCRDYAGWPEAVESIAQARSREVEIMATAAQQGDDLRLCREFRTTYGNWPEAKEALAAVRVYEVKVAAEPARKAEDSDVCRSFLKAYADWPEAAEAVAAVREQEVALEKKAALDARTVEACRTFREHYASWSEARNALAEVLAAEADLAWTEVKSHESWEGYRRFAEEYPNAPQYAEAEQRALELWGFAGPPGPDELVPRLTQTDDRDPHKVDLFAQIFNETGDAVGGLDQTRFELYENGRRVAIDSFGGMESDRPADIVFVFDTTGSMAAEISGVKAGAIRFAEDLRMRNRDVRLGLVTFGDEIRKVYPRGGGLTANVEEFRGWVAAQKADGGGDTPENSLGALLAALKMRFRPKSQVILILITDAPQHEHDRYTSETVSSAAKKLLASRVSLFSISPNELSYRFLAHTLGGELFPLTRGADFPALMSHISTMTAKQYRLTYKSELPPGEPRKVRVRAHRDNVWVRVHRIPSHDFAAALIHPASAAIVFVATRDAGLFRSTDGGLTWTPGTTDPAEQHFEALWTAGDDGRAALALSGDGSLYVTADSGATWRKVKDGPVPVAYLVQDPFDANHLMAIDGKGLYDSRDAGATWILAPTPLLASSATALSVDPVDRSLWAISATEVRETRDGGHTWSSLPFAPPVEGVELSACRYFRHRLWNGMLFAVTPAGQVLRSMDRGRTWLLIYSGKLGPQKAPARQVVFDPSLRHWVLVTTPTGVLASRDNGLTWTRVSHARDDGESVAAFGPDGKLLMASGGSGGVFLLNPVADREFISGNVYFASNSAKIDAKLYPYLGDLAVFLAKRGQVRVRVEGHTDDVGEDEYNLKLSIARAESIRDHLVARGLPADRFVIEGFGKTRPLFANTSDLNRGRNRRVEITLLAEPAPIPAYAPLGT